MGDELRETNLKPKSLTDTHTCPWSQPSDPSKRIRPFERHHSTCKHVRQVIRQNMAKKYIYHYYNVTAEVDSNHIGIARFKFVWL